jgi:hypothetical protein
LSDEIQRPLRLCVIFSFPALFHCAAPQKKRRIAAALFA